MKKQKQSIKEKEKESLDKEIEKIKKVMSVPINPKTTSLYWYSYRSHKGLY